MTGRRRVNLNKIHLAEKYFFFHKRDRCFFLDVPNEVLDLIMSYLYGKQFVALAHTCSRLHELAKTQENYNRNKSRKHPLLHFGSLPINNSWKYFIKPLLVFDLESKKLRRCFKFEEGGHYYTIEGKFVGVYHKNFLKQVHYSCTLPFEDLLHDVLPSMDEGHPTQGEHVPTRSKSSLTKDTLFYSYHPRFMNAEREKEKQYKRSQRLESLHWKRR